MNSFPFDALPGQRFLPPPPPPPPPPPAVVTLATPSVQLIPQSLIIPNTTLYGSVPTQNFVPSQGYSQFCQGEAATNMVENVGPEQPNLSSEVPTDHRIAQIQSSDNPQINQSHTLGNGMVPLPHSQLRLPPPPPPPPPLPLSSSVSTTSVTQGSHTTVQAASVKLHSVNAEQQCQPSEMYNLHHGLQRDQSPDHSVSQSSVYQRNQTSRTHPSKQSRPYNTGPPPWLLPKQAPTGLQGPWKQCAERVDISKAQSIDGDHSASSTGDNVWSSATATVGSSTITSLSDPSGPKLTPALTLYKDHKVDPKEPGLPSELTSLFEALICKLCEVVSSSNVQAKLHYSGKPHEKKVRQWLLNWSQETGQPIPKRPKVEPKGEVQPEDLYCKLCDVTFTSVKHGEQHKMGKPHQKALRLGYSNAKGKAKKVELEDPTGRFGIGQAFLNAGDSVVGLGESSLEEKQGSGTPQSSTSSSKSHQPSSKFFCSLCRVSTTSQEHLDSHYAGSKHRKALVNAAKGSSTQSAACGIPPPAHTADSILASVMRQKDTTGRRGLSSDLSIYRTPSGQFYCHTCNTTVNSEKTFREHTESKKHKFKLASAKRPSVAL